MQFREGEVGHGTAASAGAEDVPLPTPAPRAKSGFVPPTANPAPATAEAAPKGFFPFSFSLGGKGASPATAFDAKQRGLIDKVSGYLSGVQTMVGNFVQIGPDGRRVEGTFSITVTDGETRQLHAGDVVQLEDVAPCKGHITVLGDKLGFLLFAR